MLNVIDKEHLLHHEIQSCEQLDEILGNVKPLINILEEDTNINMSKIGKIKTNFMNYFSSIQRQCFNKIFIFFKL